MIAGIWHGARTLRQSGRHEGHLGCTYGGSQVPPARHFVLSGAEGSHLASWWGEYSGTLGHFERVQKAEAEGWAPYDEGVSWDVSSSARSGAQTPVMARREGIVQGDLPGKGRGRVLSDRRRGHFTAELLGTDDLDKYYKSAWRCGARAAWTGTTSLVLRGTNDLDNYYKFALAHLQVLTGIVSRPGTSFPLAGHLFFGALRARLAWHSALAGLFLGHLEGNTKNKKTRKRGHRAHPRDTRLSTLGHRAGPSPP